jgi:hypothetical protein
MLKYNMMAIYYVDIWVVPGSNFGLGNNYCDWDFLAYFLYFEQKMKQVYAISILSIKVAGSRPDEVDFF